MVANMFREISMSRVKGYHELTKQEKNIFDQEYRKHLASTHERQRIYYTESELKKVEGKGNQVKVYFKNGHTFIYRKV